MPAAWRSSPATRTTAALTTYAAGSTAWLKNPRTLNLDPLGQLWIGTDQKGHVSDTADGLFTMQTTGPSQFLLSCGLSGADRRRDRRGGVST